MKRTQLSGFQLSGEVSDSFSDTHSPRRFEVEREPTHSRGRPGQPGTDDALVANFVDREE